VGGAVQTLQRLSGEPVVRDLYGTMLHEEAQGAYLMTTGTFTKQAQAWAAEKPIILYDGQALIELIQGTKAVRRTIELAQPG
jgi:restriction endonuclease Mrr